MSGWPGLFRAEVVKIRSQVAPRAVVLSILLGPLIMVLALASVASDVSKVVDDPAEVVLGTVVLLAAIGTVVLSASNLGREFDLGTVRATVIRGASRGGWLLTKASLILLAVTGTGVVACFIGIVAAGLTEWQPAPGAMSETLLRCVMFVPLGSLPFLGMTLLGACLGRSTAAGLLAGMALFMGGVLLSGPGQRLPFAEWMPVSSVFVLLGGSFAAILPAAPSAAAATAVLRLLLVGAGLGGAAAWTFVRQDVRR